MKRVSLLGSTGSVGTQTLDVISRYPDRFQVEALTAGQNWELLIEQANRFRPKQVSVASKELADKIKVHLPSGTVVLHGEQGLIETAANNDADIVVTAIVGSQGLKPTLAAIEAGKHIGLANKETLVSGGHLVSAAAKRNNVKLLPVDSEHSAIFQCLNGESLSSLRKIVLTASGGSFRDRTREELKDVTVKEALAHPNWSMGAKITIDSATMVNKGLEVIEAHWLFELPYDRIDVVIHPESIIHSFVEFDDRSMIAQMGLPDMRVPIQYALTYPERLVSPVHSLDLTELGKLHFRKMDFDRFPCLRMAFDCGKVGGTMTAVFNAANEVAVSRFVAGDIGFLDIEDVIESAIGRHEAAAVPTLEQIEEADGWARRVAAQYGK
ncbi:1-deoxy-D-xylulose-5-phosphate reductoisomerase [Paenibacillus hemerocallicola]|uniref:1-deoxy-D-xylulose 5-phosphate reductoisomerase n=1 Tax=Paenibacillus hemerocallicola TaxID=1172614 RepID=A0A5C4T6P9_9BACL|nr:1-deoxy-D-xylulose-5-phosphate reductoisomerase [Paenibacillus hemerocallicola]TNJ64330.1 1-deoxy-D-xylulose-5-phosphate reductoisomerase [Paenibacillus hemerocallicola]